jgi:HD-GYP domain-containing protein (c-di-GMP phosphodiesterase class II)
MTARPPPAAEPVRQRPRAGCVRGRETRRALVSAVVEPPRDEPVRAAEVIAAVCLATDLGMGFPFEHGLHATIVAMRLGDRLGVDAPTASQLYYSSLLTYAGCTADAEVAAGIFGGDLSAHLVPVLHGSPRESLGGLLRALPPPDAAGPGRALEIARRLPRAARADRPHLVALCEVASMLAERLGLSARVAGLFAYLTERWDGHGRLRRAAADTIPLAIRIAHVARDAAYQRLHRGVEGAAGVVRERAGHAFDPDVAHALADDAAEILAVDAGASAWAATLACEPEPRLTLAGAEIDRALAAIGDFADLLSPYLAGHSGGVARLAEAAARRCGVEPAPVRRAALVHDLGRVAVGARTWQRAGLLSADEWEKVRLHPYQTERVLSRSAFLSALAPVAGAHHERLDGSGYHRGAHGAELPPAARVLAAADAYHAMTEARPHRPAHAPERAAQQLTAGVSAGLFDPDAAAAVIEAAGHPPPRMERPAGLTEREAQVVGLLARGLQTKEVARALGISVKTADRHVQNAYGKIGVSTRAAATLFAMEHGLAAWGELPMARSRALS